MKKLTASIIALATSATMAHSVVLVGLDPLVGDGGPDGWSGVSVLDTPIEGAGTVTDWGFYAHDDRAAAQPGEHYVTPLVLGRDSAGAVSILGVGTEVQVNVGGVHEQAFGLTAGSADYGGDAGTTYLGGVWQRREGVNNADGGIIPFAGAGGGGMFQYDRDGTSYVPAVDGVALGDAGHASPVDGRNYAFNLQNIPEPTVPAFLIAAVGLVGFFRRRR